MLQQSRVCLCRQSERDDALDPYAKNRQVYRCPSDETNGAGGMKVA